MALTQVTKSGITADAIDATKIADNAVDSEHIAADSIDAEHYAAGSVDATALGADAVTAAKIGDDVIESEHYAATSIDNEHLADDAVGVAELSATGTASSSTFLRGDNSWTAVSTPITALNSATANELVTVGATTTELDAEANLTFDGSNLTLTSSDIVFATAGKGICLGVTSNTDSNTLDDYEEGEVTNALDINGTTQTSYSSGRGNLQYTRVGRIVHIQAYLDTQGATLATTGIIHIRLPFAVSAGSGTAFITGAAAYVQNVNGVAYPCNAYLNEGDSTISGNYLSSDGNASSITGGSTIEVSNTGHRIIQQYSFSYQTD